MAARSNHLGGALLDIRFHLEFLAESLEALSHDRVCEEEFDPIAAFSTLAIQLEDLARRLELLQEHTPRAIVNWHPEMPIATFATEAAQEAGFTVIPPPQTRGAR